MANTISYPKATVKSSDLILGTSIPLPNTNDDPRTVNFSVGQITSLSNTSNILTSTFELTSSQLQTLGTIPVVLISLDGDTDTGEYIQLISASILTGGIYFPLDSGYTWDLAGAYIASSSVTTGNRIIIPDDQLPTGYATTIFPWTVAALDGSYARGSDLIISTLSDPIITGTPSGTLTINLTYRILPQS